MSYKDAALPKELVKGLQFGHVPWHPTSRIVASVIDNMVLSRPCKFPQPDGAPDDKKSSAQKPYCLLLLLKWLQIPESYARPVPWDTSRGEHKSCML